MCICYQINFRVTEFTLTMKSTMTINFPKYTSNRKHFTCYSKYDPSISVSYSIYYQLVFYFILLTFRMIKIELEILLWGDDIINHIYALCKQLRWRFHSSDAKVRQIKVRGQQLPSQKVYRINLHHDGLCAIKECIFIIRLRTCQIVKA